jgi:hypothetical protein
MKDAPAPKADRTQDAAVARLLCADPDFAARYLGTNAVLSAALPVVLDALVALPEKAQVEFLDRLRVWMKYRREADRQLLAELLGATLAQ